MSASIDWDKALAPASSGRVTVPGPSTPAVKPAPFRSCSRCGKGFQRWPLLVDGRASDELECPPCRSVPAPVKVALELERVAADEAAIPY